MNCKIKTAHIFLTLLIIFSIIAISCSEATRNSENITFPNNENGDVLRLLQSKGFDFSKEHVFEYEHIFKEKDSAQKFAEEIEKQNMKAEMSYYEEMSAWNIKVKVTHLPTHDKITNTEDKLEKIAINFGGKKDGWGVVKN